MVGVVTGAQRGAAPATKRPFDKAQGRPAPPSKRPATERPVPFKPGETLGFDVSWSNFVTAGTATVTVKEKRPSFGSVAYYIVAEGRPTPLLSKIYTLYYKVDTLLDAYTLLPQRGSVYSEEGRRRRLKVTSFDHRARKAQYEVQTATTVKEELKLPPYVQDALSAIYVIRSLPLSAGGKMTMPVSDSGKNYRVQLTVGASETVRTPLGALRAWRITPVILGEDGKPEGRGMALWLSDDARRLPLKIEGQLTVGKFVITLRDVKGNEASPETDEAH
jgi:hypothetical protein